MPRGVTTALPLKNIRLEVSIVKANIDANIDDNLDDLGVGGEFGCRRHFLAPLGDAGHKTPWRRPRTGGWRGLTWLAKERGNTAQCPVVIEVARGDDQRRSGVKKEKKRREIRLSRQR